MLRELFPFFCLRFFGSLANQFLQFAVPLMIYKTTGSVAWSGIAFFVEWLPRIFSFPLAGAAVDRFGPCPVYLVADAIRLFASVFAYLGIMVFPNQTHLILIGLAVVTGFFFEQAFIAIEQVARKLAPQLKMHRAQSILAGIDHATELAGPALAGTIASSVEPKVLLVVTAGIFLVSAVIVRRVSNENLRPEGNRQGLFIAKLYTGFKTLTRIRKLVLIVLLTTIMNVMLGLSLTIAPAVTTGIFDMPDGYLGIVYTLSGMTGLISVTATPWLADRFKISRVGIGAFLISCAAFLGIGLASSFWAYAAATSILMAMDGAFTVYIRTERARLIPAEQFGSTVGLIVLLNFVPLPFAGLLVASGVSVVGLQALIVSVAVLAFGFSLPLLRLLAREIKTGGRSAASLN
jgi:Na+/melibiose symporter-like transporter